MYFLKATQIKISLPCPCNFYLNRVFLFTTRPNEPWENERGDICDDELLLCCVSQYWDLPSPWVQTGSTTVATFGMTESIAVLTGALIGATLLVTAIN